MEMMQQLGEQVGTIFENAINAGVSGFVDLLVEGQLKAQELGNMLKDIGKQILKAGIMLGLKAITGDVTGSVGGNIIKGITGKKMATGGTVPAGFPNDTYPALLSSGETVLPNPIPIPSGGGSTSGANYSNEIIATVRGEDLVLVLNRYNQRAGRIK